MILTALTFAIHAHAVLLFGPKKEPQVNEFFSKIYPFTVPIDFLIGGIIQLIIIPMLEKD